MIIQSGNNSQLNTSTSESNQIVQSATNSGFQVVNLADGATFIPIGNSPFFQLSSANDNNSNISDSTVNLVNSLVQQSSHSGRFLSVAYPEIF